MVVKPLVCYSTSECLSLPVCKVGVITFLPLASLVRTEGQALLSIGPGPLLGREQVSKDNNSRLCSQW